MSSRNRQTDQSRQLSVSPSDSCQLTLDTNTVNRKILVSDRREAAYVEEEQPYPDHPDRFDEWPQLLCRNGLTGRCYWEVEWSGHVDIAVSHRGINRLGRRYDCRFGRNDQSWSLECSDDGYCVWHNNGGTTTFTSSSSSSLSNRAAVYVDCAAGTLSFYMVSSDGLTHLHTYSITSSELLYPGFGFWAGWSGSVRLCSLQEGGAPPAGQPESSR